MILVDTSVWIELFRRRAPLDLEAVVDWGDIVTCLPIIQEVLQGFREEVPFRAAREAMLSFPVIEEPLTRATFLAAADLYRAARQQGVTVRSSVDCLIAACAIRQDLEVRHRDRDFTNLARVSSLRQRVL